MAGMFEVSEKRGHTQFWAPFSQEDCKEGSCGPKKGIYKIPIAQIGKE
jgi:hypothetical protein